MNGQEGMLELQSSSQISWSKNKQPFNFCDEAMKKLEDLESPHKVNEEDKLVARAFIKFTTLQRCLNLIALKPKY